MVLQSEGKKREKSGFYGPDKQTSGRTYRLTDTLLGCTKMGRRKDLNTLDILMWKLGCDAQGQVKKGRRISEDHQHEEGLNFKVCLEISVTANTAVGFMRLPSCMCVCV